MRHRLLEKPMSEHTDAKNSELEQRIRERAFHLWQEAGSPEGRHEEFWHRAREIEERGGAEGGVNTEDSFPASDPPSNSGIVGPGKTRPKT